MCGGLSQCDVLIQILPQQLKLKVNTLSKALAVEKSRLNLNCTPGHPGLPIIMIITTTTTTTTTTIVIIIIVILINMSNNHSNHDVIYSDITLILDALARWSWV